MHNLPLMANGNHFCMLCVAC